MKRLFLSLFVAFSIFNSVLQAKLEDHFKKIENKSNIHKMRNIDFIYLINLDQRPEKFQKCIDQLHPYGIYPYRFSAVNGWELTLEDINDVGLKFEPGMQGGFMATSYLTPDLKPTHNLVENFGQAYFVHCFARGTIGICLSHLSILQDAYDSGYKTIWVMEDDIEVIRDPTIIPDLIDQLNKAVGKNNWDVLFTDRDFRNGNGEYTGCSADARRPNFNPVKKNDYALKKDINPVFRKIGSRYGAHSMIISRRGIAKILNFIKSHKIFLPYDLDFYLPLGINLYTVREDVVANLPKAISDNGGANYLKKDKDKNKDKNKDKKKEN
ncbi:MAG: glycosyltransferase family 25 protein [Parachlamydiaceae bacterium]|nr:glycosyltransferase family 25 protein [Parachlamydiaceae bacterium]